MDAHIASDLTCNPSAMRIIAIPAAIPTLVFRCWGYDSVGGLQFLGNIAPRARAK